MTLPMMLRVNHNWHNYWRLLSNFHPLIPLAFGGGAGAVAATKYLQDIRERRASTWPSADAQVESAAIRKRQKYWIVYLSYRYYAQQEYHNGKYQKPFQSYAAAEQFADAVRAKQIRVRFKEDKPRVSVLTRVDLQLAGALKRDDKPE